jgi:catechol 2,3-dioxygenase
MSASLQLRSVKLRVRDISRSVSFYQGQLGLAVVEQELTSARLSAFAGGIALLELVEERSATHAAADSAGLFHAAMLLSSRAALGRWLRETTEARVRFDGFSDHGVSEALYLSDPDGNGLEFYADRSPDEWPRNNRGELEMGSDPLDLPGLLAEGARATTPALDHAEWGHLHLRVADPDRSATFYNQLLGTQLTQRFGPNARFIAADGYHHHLGLNNWGGIRHAQPPGHLGLIEATFAKRDDTASLYTDPDGIAVRTIPL